jgi:hypothetical protein
MKSIPNPIRSSTSGFFPSLIRPPVFSYRENQKQNQSITGGGQRIKSKEAGAAKAA